MVTPYLALVFSYWSSKVTLACSPWLATIDARVPIHFLLNFGPPIAGRVESGSYFRLQGTGGLVLDLDIESSVELAPGLSLDVWGNLNYLDWRNKGKASVDFLRDPGVPAIPPFNLLNQGSASVAEGSHIRRSSYSLGIGASLLF